MQIGDKVRIIAEDCLDGSSGCRDLCNCHNSTAVIEALPLLNFHTLCEIRFENGLKCNLAIDEFELIELEKLYKECLENLLKDLK